MNKEKISSGNKDVFCSDKIVTRGVFGLMMESILKESEPLLQLDNLHDMSELLKTTH